MKIKIGYPDENGKPTQFTISAEPVRGTQFAIHHDVRYSMRQLNRLVYNRSGYTITHRPTGYAMAKGIIRKHQAIEIARFVASVPMDWSKSDPRYFKRQQQTKRFRTVRDEASRMISRAKRRFDEVTVSRGGFAA